MNPAHLHLILNHLPVMATLCGIVVMIYGMVKKSNVTLNASCLLFILASAGGILTYVTGEPAEEIVEGINQISESSIEEHEDSAGIALALIIMQGIMAAAGIWINANRPMLAAKFFRILFIFSFLCVLMVARTGYLGGLIRHTEVSATPSSTNHDHEHDD